MTSDEPKKGFFTKFSGQFWLVVMFEFFERGAYYGMMSFLSQYFVDQLGFPKDEVGVIKGVIQPLLYFLPIIAGAIADRFGYRKVLMVAFTLLGGGYFLTSQMTSYTAVFAALVIMGFGAGTFKPMISGTIAKITDESNSTQAFGIYYWSINMGAFLFPLVLVPVLKSINPSYVIIASGICTAAMLIPTALFFKEPVKQQEVDDKTQKREQATMLQTIANAFEIIYSPIVLVFNWMKRSAAAKGIIMVVLLALLGLSIQGYLGNPPASEKFFTIGMEKGATTFVFKVKRDMGKKDPYKLEVKEDSTPPAVNLTVYKPQYLDKYKDTLLQDLKTIPDLASITEEDIRKYIDQSIAKVEVVFAKAPKQTENFVIKPDAENYVYTVLLKDAGQYKTYKEDLLKEMHKFPMLRGLSMKDLGKLHNGVSTRSFFLFFVISMILLGLLVVAVSTSRMKAQAAAPDTSESAGVSWAHFVVPLVIVAIWFLPGLGMLARVICSVIYLSVMSLFIIDKSDPLKFVDHAKFLLMIVLYSGFWILYFQMFDAVLWYVQAYVDAESLNQVVNSIPALFGIKTNWFFDVEHVTVINALTIIVLQLVVSAIVRKKKAMPTMIAGITIATIGMALLAVSTSIWIFMAGIVIFSVGEMTAHPKFISYVGLTAPSDKKAMYMGYIFLYGVFGSSIGGIVGANLYVHFVDNLNQPRVLWLVFSLIGVATIIGLLLYNKFLAPKKEVA